MAKIIAVHFYRLQRELRCGMRISRGGFCVRQHAIVELVSDDGTIGVGEGIGQVDLIQAILASGMAQSIIGEDPTNLEGIRSRIINQSVYYERMGSSLCAASAIEMACWDILGKKLNLPVAYLLGGWIRDHIPAYASDIYWEEQPEKMAENAHRLVQLGYKTIKIHIGVLPPRQERIRLEAIREAIGEEIELMVDLNAGYDLYSTLEAFRDWEKYRLAWLEEPLAPDQYGAMKTLAQKSPFPLAAGENEFKLHGFKQLLENQCVHIIMPDAGRVGGLGEMRRIFSLAEAYGIPVSPHNFSSGILLAATMQFAAAMPNFRLLEMDASQNAVYQELLSTPLKLNNQGELALSHLPGLGVNFKAEDLQDFIQVHQIFI